MAGGKHLDATTDSLGKGKILNLEEIGSPEPIEKVAESDFVKAAELEAFMNEILTVIVHEDGNDNAVENPCPSVNGVNQGFIRGKEQNVKRKYVEALARGRKTKYVQRILDPTRPESIQMVETTSLVYPFSVLRDPNPKGKEWLRSILAQPS